MNRIGVLAALALSLSAAACGSSPSPASVSSSSSIVRGQVALSSYALDNPVLVAHAADGRAFFAPIQSDGSFALTVPSGVGLTLAIANSTRDGGYVAISRVQWPALASSWGRVDGSTATIALGRVHPATNAGAVLTQSHGGGDDDGGSPSSGSESSGSSSDDSSGSAETSGELHSCGTAAPGRSDLPYDMQPALGSTFALKDAFLAKGPAPAAVLSVTMDGGSWRLAELQSGASFTITQADCDHAGNRSTGRDRIEVTWQNADGSTSSDHLDMRYCDGSGGATTQSQGSSSQGADDGGNTDDCESDGTPVCYAPSVVESVCDGHGDGLTKDDGDHDDAGACSGADGGANGTTPGGGGAAGGGNGTTAGGGGNGTTAGGAGDIGDACGVNADCGVGLQCMASRCQTPVK